MLEFLRLLANFGIYVRSSKPQVKGQSWPLGFLPLQIWAGVTLTLALHTEKVFPYGKRVAEYGKDISGSVQG